MRYAPLLYFILRKMNHRTHEKAYTFKHAKENLIKSTSSRERGRREIWARSYPISAKNLVTQVWLESDHLRAREAQ